MNSDEKEMDPLTAGDLADAIEAAGWSEPNEKPVKLRVRIDLPFGEAVFLSGITLLEIKSWRDNTFLKIWADLARDDHEMISAAELIASVSALPREMILTIVVNVENDGDDENYVERRVATCNFCPSRLFVQPREQSELVRGLQALVLTFEEACDGT